MLKSPLTSKAFRAPEFLARHHSLGCVRIFTSRLFPPDKYNKEILPEKNVELESISIRRN